MSSCHLHLKQTRTGNSYGSTAPRPPAPQPPEGTFFFAWLLAKERLPTKKNLHAKTIVSSQLVIFVDSMMKRAATHACCALSLATSGRPSLFTLEYLMYKMWATSALLQPSRWRTTWPSSCFAGGVCGTIATISSLEMSSLPSDDSFNVVLMKLILVDWTCSVPWLDCGFSLERSFLPFYATPTYVMATALSFCLSYVTSFLMKPLIN